MAAAAALRHLGRSALRPTARLYQSQSQAGIFSSIRPRRLTVDEKEESVVQYAEILMKKEELYTHMADFHRKFRIPGRVGRQDRMLLQQLSGQVKARPDDLHWRLYQRCQRYRRFFTFLGALYCVQVFPVGLGWLMGHPEPSSLALGFGGLKKPKQ